VVGLLLNSEKEPQMELMVLIFEESTFAVAVRSEVARAR
jgi:hypothetical protein